MPIRLGIIATLSTALTLLAVSAHPIDESQFSPADIIVRDVAIVGGGAAGSHAAVRLSQDFHKSVVLVDKAAQLGGHVDTYVDPDTGVRIEFGVQAYYPYKNTLSFFERFNITLGAQKRLNTSITRYADFTTGQEVNNFTPVDATLANAAVQRYLEIIEENGYEDILVPGYWKFPPGNQIPEDLLLPVGDFVKKHGIEPLLSRMWSVTGGGVGSRGNFASIPTLTVMQAFAPLVARAVIGQVVGSVPINGNMELYEKIAILIGPDVLLETTVVDARRDDGGIQLIVQNNAGQKKLIKAQRLLLAIQPTRENLVPFDLDANETEHWSKPTYGRSWTTIAKHPILQNGTAIVNLNASAIRDPLFSFLRPPFATRFEHYGQPTQLFRVPLGSNDYGSFDQEGAKATAQKALQNLADAGTIPQFGGEKLNFVAMSDHAAVGFGVSATDLRNDWIGNFNALQGKRKTWYTGGSVATDFTTTLWDYNESLFPLIVAGL